jgi:hypothetical protein
MTPPLLLYSTNTWLAFAIAESFYDSVHYVWCSPCYDGTTAAAHVNIPPTASPADIYRNLHEESRRGERHSAAIVRNRSGILRGAEARKEAGMISGATEAEIRTIVNSAETRDFRPVLYLIPYDRVRELVVDVPVAQRAHPLSVEYRVEALPRGCFDMLELWS